MGIKSDEIASVISDDRVSGSKASDTGDESARSGTPSTSSSLSLAREETKAVNRSKMCMLLVLVIAAVSIGSLTFDMLSRAELKEFEIQFHDFAVEISALVHQEASNVFLSADALSTTVTSYALSKSQDWPFVSLPHFEVRGMKANGLSKALMLIFCPLVEQEDRIGWESYSVKNQGWIEEGVNYNSDLHKDYFVNGEFKADQIPNEIFRFEDEKHIPEIDNGPYLPVWQMAPAPHTDSIINYNLLSHPIFAREYHESIRTGQPLLSEVMELDFLYGGSIRNEISHPHSFLLQPVFERFLEKEMMENKVVGFIISILPWDHYFENILPEEAQGINVVLGDTCNQTYTYLLNGRVATYLGPGDLHDPKYDELFAQTPFDPYHHYNSTIEGHCEFYLKIYPTSILEEIHQTRRPALFTFVVLMVFFMTSMVFIMYDTLVQRRQDKVMASAKRSNAIVSSIFPSNVRDRIMKDAEGQEGSDMKDKNGKRVAFGKNNLKNFLDEGNAQEKESLDVFGSKPIADLFPEATVLFADIVGFTAWSSVREPSQVFQLLETFYHAFDEIARRRRVFKVETIGDCYVAVTGLPEPRPDHAVVMARFARDCLAKVNDLAKKLEVSLGPDTGDLTMRIGMNSGPVTAGVLRGEKARFQLFGDTVNTASRIESNGERNMIHASQSTADLLEKAKKGHWVTARKEKIFAKGKGDLQTYWVDLKGQSSPSVVSGVTNSTNGDDEATEIKAKQPEVPSNQIATATATATSTISVVDHMREDGLTDSIRKPLISDKVERLVSWNCDVLQRLLKQVVARRRATHRSRNVGSSSGPLTFEKPHGATVLDEVKEIITLPLFDAKAACAQEDPNKIELDHDVISQLHDYVTIIATMYLDNAFHNFEHASHVSMSVVKLMSRIVAPAVLANGDTSDYFDKNLHDHTYGITSDPLTQFAVAFSALIHDVDHSGVPNAQLVKEKSGIAKIYNNKSVAEQNSVDIAWDLLMDPSFEVLRSAIYTNRTELKHFRELVVNTVMATDIVDKELKELRNARWERAFQAKEAGYKETKDDINRKATIVIEHLIQASDVAHTMQHWHIYRKWNERFFQENLHAYECGRAEKDPSEFWYKGEMGFFDFYIIPLAKKLKNCGVFGVSSDEYLDYAIANRKEWEIKGEAVVAEMREKYKRKQFSYAENQCMLGEESKHERKGIW